MSGKLTELKSAKGKELKMPYSDLALSIEYKGVAVSDEENWYWCISPIEDEEGKTHLFCSRWPDGNKMMSWIDKSEIVHFVGDSPEGPFKFSEVVLSNHNVPDKAWQRAPHNPHIHKIDGKYVLTFILHDTRTKWKDDYDYQYTGLMWSDTPYGPWNFITEDGIVVRPSTDPNHWTYGSILGTDNPAMAKIDEKYYIFFKAGLGQDERMAYGYAVSDTLMGEYKICDHRITDNISYIEDVASFNMDGKNYLLTTDNFGTNTGIFGAGILWERAGDLYPYSKAKIGFGVLSDYVELSEEATFVYNEKSTKLERPAVLMRNGKPAYFYASTRTSLRGTGKSETYVFKVNL